MSEPVLPFILPGFVVDAVRTVDATTLSVEAHPVAMTAACPRCQQPSQRVHSRYRRCPRDLPSSEQAVQLYLSVRRFFCDQPSCAQRTFAERLPDLLPVRAQRTQRLSRTLEVVAGALGGEAGARLSGKLRMPTSSATLLRILRQAPTTETATPRVLGVDDFALRRGQRYGTILVDLEQHQPVDLLPDRTAATLATWLREHPGVEVLTRDRSKEYALGATTGAPEAQQVADRWHLLQNLREVLERMLTRLHGDLRRLPPCSVTAAPPEERVATVPARPLRAPSAAECTLRQARREQRVACYETVRRLHSDGIPLLQIAKQLGLSRTTVRKFAYAPVFPERAQPQARPSMLDAYVSYLEQRWTAGCHNSSQLWRELQAQGYGGVRKQVARWVQQRRQRPAATTPKKYVRPDETRSGQCDASLTPEAHWPRLAGARQLVWLLLREPAELSVEDAATFARLSQHCDVAVASTLAQAFQGMVRQRTPEALDGWLEACAASGIPDLQSFATGLQQDEAAVRGALGEPWSNGQTEGQITRVKLVKRQMYGRANFDLLRQRVLYAA